MSVPAPADVVGPETVVHGFTNAWNTHDMAAYDQLFTDAAVWVAVAESPTNRRRLGEHAGVLRAAFPSDGRTVAGWLRRPSGPLLALSFLSNARVANRTAARSSRRRVRAASPAVARSTRVAEPDQMARGTST